MSQRSFFDLEYSAQRKQTWRERFLREIDTITPYRRRWWRRSCRTTRRGSGDRAPIGLERMLRMYVAQP